MKSRIVTLNGKKFTLSKKYRDTMLGVEGVATAGVTYLTGCDQLEIKWVGPDGSINTHWVDVIYIKSVEKERAGKSVEKKPGGPQPTIPTRCPPRR